MLQLNDLNQQLLFNVILTVLKLSDCKCKYFIQQSPCQMQNAANSCLKFRLIADLKFNLMNTIQYFVYIVYVLFVLLYILLLLYIL